MTRRAAGVGLILVGLIGAESVGATGPEATGTAGWSASPIPAFSRKYGTSCSTCHVAPGKLNAQGEAFRLNAYRFPDEEDRLRREEPVPLAAEPWKDLWPDAVWPGEIPGGLPLSLHIANDVKVARQADGGLASDFLFPTSVVLQAGASLGEGVAAFFAAMWQPSGVRLLRAKIALQDPIPGLPPRALNVWIGRQSPHLLMFGDASLDRALRQTFLWQRLRLSDWPIDDPDNGRTLVSESSFTLSGARPSIELNGILGGRFSYGLGLAQPTYTDTADPDRSTDVYLKVRYKLGGMGLDGGAPPGGEPTAWGGQLLERGVTLEQFAYAGATPLRDGGADEHRSFGVALRAVQHRLDVGLGHVWGRHSRPWGVADLQARHASTFGRVEYLLFPWLLGSVKLERSRVRALPEFASGAGPLERRRVQPGVAVLLRHNVRVLAEGEFFLRRGMPGQSGSADALWLRLDLGF